MKSVYGIFAFFAFMISQNHGSPTIPLVQLDHLDEYSLLSIFDFLEFDQLVNVASTSDELRQIIINHYMIPEFRIHEKVIRLAIYEYPKKTPNNIVIRDGQILPFFRNFGHLITSLQYFAELTDSIAFIEQVNDYIMQYCSNTLIELELGRMGVRLTTTSNKIFKRLTKLKLNSWTDFKDMDLKRIFPELEELTISSPDVPADSVAQSYLKLRRLHLHEFAANSPALEELLRLNPQLQELTIRRVPSFGFLEFISKTLVNLEYLSIYYKLSSMSLEDGQNVHFESLKGFSIRMQDWDPQPHVTPITFKHLETLEISTYHSSIPTNLLKDNFELKSISLPLADARIAAGILMQAGPFRALEEVKLQWKSVTDAFIIRQIIDRIDSLRRIILITYKYTEDDLSVDSIKANFEDGNGWQVTDNKLAEAHGILSVYHITISRT